MKIKNRLLNFKDMYIFQDSDWFNFSLDSVLLANFVTISASDKKIIDFGTGNAPVPMLLTIRTNNLIYAIEIQKEIYDLAVSSVDINNLNDKVHLINDDIKNIFSYFQQESFDVITCNPPYFKVEEKAIINENEIKAMARHEIGITLEEIIRISSKLLKNGGHLCMVHRTSRFVEILSLMKKYNIEPKRIRFVFSHDDKDSNIFLIEGYKNGKSGLKILSPLFVHDKDGNYLEEIRDYFGGGIDVAK